MKNTLPTPEDEGQQRMAIDAPLFALSTNHNPGAFNDSFDAETAAALDAQVDFLRSCRIDAAILSVSREEILLQYAWHLQQWEPYKLAQLLALAVERLTLTKEPK